MEAPMRKIFRPLTVSLMVVWIGLAQQSSPAVMYLNQLDFSRYPLVDLYVTLIDGRGEPIVLAARDSSMFRIDHNDIRVYPADLQSVIALKEKGESELFLALVFDNSESMIGRTQLLEVAALQFIDSLRTGDNACIIDFGDGTKKVKVPEFPHPLFGRLRLGFSNSKTFLRKNIPIKLMTSRTFMYDAVLHALSVVNSTSVLGRKAIILFSDGQENGSVVTLDVVKTFIRQYNIPIYAIDLNLRVNTTLQELAKMSGGEYFFVKEPKDLANLYQTVLKLLRGQYRLTYRTPEANISANNYSIRLSMRGRYDAEAIRTFSVDGENIAYFNLAYLESEGKESLHNYLEYVSGFPKSRHTDNVRLKIGSYWQRRGELARAMAAYNIILRNPLSPAYSQALLQKADLYASAKEYAAAQKTYNQVISTEQNSAIRARAMLELAKAYTAEGNFALALNTYSQLSSQYEGTELASEAFLQSATLSMEMGDLPAAEKNLEQVVQSYGESKTAVFARMELAKIAERTNRLDDAVRYYEDILKTNADPDIKDEASLNLSKVRMTKGDVTGAITALRAIASGASPLIASAARMQLVPALLKSGSVREAREIYEQLSSEAQAQLWRDFDVVSTSVDGVRITSLVNGAYVSVPSGGGSEQPITIIDWPDAVQKFSAIGPVYHLSAPAGSARAAFPVRADWLANRLVVPGISGIFHFENGNWEHITSSYNAATKAYEFQYAKPGIYALLAKPPRIIRLYSIHFDLGKADIRKEDERNLFEIIDDLKAVPDAKLEIGGHTDTTGSEERNIELSSERANAIKRFMVINGIEPDRLIARGYGSQYPIAPNDSPENMQKNRRTEFTLIRPIADPTGAVMGERKNYTVFLKAYRTAKDAYEDKKMFQNRGFNVMVMTNEAKLSEKYEMSLGIFDSEEDAKKAIADFVKEFKGIEPQIIVSKRTR
jgi:outer membrane protein OmpA-like peptidoglycan-associated protein/predicted negative regulator of RcsB-dependent stress response